MTINSVITVCTIENYFKIFNFDKKNRGIDSFRNLPLNGVQCSMHEGSFNQLKWPKRDTRSASIEIIDEINGTISIQKHFEFWKQNGYFRIWKIWFQIFIKSKENWFEGGEIDP